MTDVSYTRSMKKMIVLASVFVLAATALAHPGKTDRFGGHKCLKDCEEWGLYYSEYHLHDKDGKPIRVSRKKNAIPMQEQNEKSSATATAPTVIDAPRTEQTVTEYRYVTVAQEESALSLNPLLLMLLVLLLLWLILRLNRKTERDSER